MIRERLFPEHSGTDIGNYARRAILDVASNLGGEELAEKLKPAIHDRTQVYPIVALRQIIDECPNANELVLRRGKQIIRQVSIDEVLRRVTGRPFRSSESLIAEYGPYREKKSVADIFRRKRNR